MALIAYNQNASANTLVDANGAALATLPASAAAGVDAAALDVTINLRGLSNADYTVLATRAAAAATQFRVEWSTGFPEYNLGSLPFGVAQVSGAGVARKRDARVNPIGNIADLTSTSTTMDGVVVVAGNRVYLTDQTTGSQNGLYRVASVTAALCRIVRSEDMDVSTEVEPGTEIIVSEGTVRSNTRLTITNAATITIGTTALTHTREPVAGGGSSLEVIGGVGGITAGQPVYLSGFDAASGLFSVLPADANAADVAGPIGSPRNPLYVARAAIAAGARGVVHRTARITAFDASASAVGRAVYLSATAGQFTLTLPTAADTKATVVGRVAVVGVAGPPATGELEIDMANAMPQYIGNRDLVPGIVSADAAGRALVATDFFDVATALDKFAADSIANAFLLDAVADGAFVADAGTRALFAADFIDPPHLDEGGAFVWTGSQTFSTRMLLTRTSVLFAASPYTLLATDIAVVADTVGGVIVINLPVAATATNRILFVKNAPSGGTNNVTVTPNGAETIDGAANLPLGPNESAMLLCDGAAWRIVATKILRSDNVSWSGTFTHTGATTFSAGVFHTRRNIVFADSPYAPVATDNEILVSTAAPGAVTVALPAAAGLANRRLFIKHSAGTLAVTVDGNGAETIDGQATYVVRRRGGVVLECDGTEWHVISERKPGIVLANGNAALDLGVAALNVEVVTGTPGAGGNVYTLPLATGSNRAILVKNLVGSAGVITVTPQAAEQVDAGGAGVGHALAAGQSATYIDNAATSWIVT